MTLIKDYISNEIMSLNDYITENIGRDFTSCKILFILVDNPYIPKYIFESFPSDYVFRKVDRIDDFSVADLDEINITNELALSNEKRQKKRILFYVPNNEIETIKIAYSIICYNNDILPIILINKYRFDVILYILDDVLPPHLIEEYRIKEIANEKIVSHLKQKLPSITKEMIDIFVMGINNNVIFANKIVNFIIDGTSNELFLLNKDNIKYYHADFSKTNDNKYLLTSNKMEVEVPRKILLLDTSALFSSLLIPLLKKIKSESHSIEWIYHNSVMIEVNRLEEKSKRGDSRQIEIIKIYRENMNYLLDKCILIESSKIYDSDGYCKETDSRIVLVAQKNNCIIVTADKNICSNCKLKKIPVIFLLT